MLLKSNSSDTKISVGMLTKGTYGIAHVLCMSFPDADTLSENWSVLNLCQHWRLQAIYGDKVTLKIQAWGDPIPMDVFPREMGLSMLQTYQGAWTLSDAKAVRFFMAGCKQRGYFVLLPAIMRTLVETHRPILAFLRRRVTL